jgi:hypothetical protein
VTIKAVDSAWAPTAQQIAVAKAHGVGAWLGYFKLGNDGILSGWSDAAFQLVKTSGLETAAFCSTRADQAVLKARAAALDIVLISDVESSVNGGDGPYVDPALAVSAAGLYGGGPRGDGTIPRHLPHRHHHYVVSDYELNQATLGRGSLSWPPHDAKPAGIPVGWQYQGGTAMPWGMTDLAVYDDDFFQATPTPLEDDAMFLATAGIRPATEGQDPHGNGAVYLCEGLQSQPGMFKRWFSGVAAGGLPDYEARYGGIIQNYDAFVLDRMIELAPIDTTSPTLEQGTATGILTPAQAAALAAIPGLATAVNALAAKVGKDLA